MKKSREALSRKLGIAFGKGVDEDTLEIAEEILLASDLGWELTEIVLKRFREEFKLNSESDWK
ncbi:MAG: signal recognition particle-docking protein FtsY, partial [Candidatus Fermentibacteria bacterium]|nr:signal recognition particle-docking protein FtsY [Candidatus Fermentibacteria bacterium]